MIPMMAEIINWFTGLLIFAAVIFIGIGCSRTEPGQPADFKGWAWFAAIVIVVGVIYWRHRLSEQMDYSMRILRGLQ